MWSVTTRNAEETRTLGRVLAEVVRAPCVVSLVGDLGAGKTCLAQGAGEGLGVEGEVVSPTFVLVAEYEGRLPMLHADGYRLEPGEAEGIGLDEQLESWPGLALVEWADRVSEAMPLDHVRVEIDTLDEGRRFVVTASGPRSAPVVQAWRARWDAR